MNVRLRPAFAALVVLAATHTGSAAAPAAAAPDPCTLLTLDQIKAVLNAPVSPGKPAATDDARECTWKDPGGHDRVYLNVKEVKEWKAFRDSMQATGKMTPVTGVAEDAFFIGSAGTSAAFYTLKKGHVVLLTVDGNGYTKAENQAAEKTLASQVLGRL